MSTRRSPKTSTAPSRPDEGYCLWCHGPAGASPYRSPIPGLPGGRETICGPDCPARPGSRMVVVKADWR